MDYSPQSCKELDMTEGLTLSLTVPHQTDLPDSSAMSLGPHTNTILVLSKTPHGISED